MKNKSFLIQSIKINNVAFRNNAEEFVAQVTLDPTLIPYLKNAVKNRFKRLQDITLNHYSFYDLTPHELTTISNMTIEKSQILVDYALTPRTDASSIKLDLKVYKLEQSILDFVSKLRSVNE